MPDSCWLYTRGSESVRLVREENSKECRLSMYGPGTEVVAYVFADVTECMKQQSDIEQHLQAAGYQLAQSSSDRRHTHRAWLRSGHRHSTVA